MPNSDCGLCDLLINCNGHVTTPEQFQTLVAKLLCEGVDSFAELSVLITAMAADVAANTAASAAIAANTAAIAVNTAAIAANVLELIDHETRIGVLEGAAVAAFEWTTAEQVWPFETDVGGGTIYAKFIDMVTAPNNNSVTVAHGITGLLRVLTVDAIAEGPTDWYPLVYVNNSGGSPYSIAVNGTNVVVSSTANWGSAEAKVYLKYTKT